MDNKFLTENKEAQNKASLDIFWINGGIDEVFDVDFNYEATDGTGEGIFEGKIAKFQDGRVVGVGKDKSAEELTHILIGVLDKLNGLSICSLNINLDQDVPVWYDAFSKSISDSFNYEGIYSNETKEYDVVSVGTSKVKLASTPVSFDCASKILANYQLGKDAIEKRKDPFITGVLYKALNQSSSATIEEIRNINKSKEIKRYINKLKSNYGLKK